MDQKMSELLLAMKRDQKCQNLPVQVVTIIQSLSDSVEQLQARVAELGRTHTIARCRYHRT